MNGTEESHEEDIIIVDESRPLVQYNAQQGGEILIKGSVKLESDKPKMCFTATYTPGAITDYFSCKDCNINCKSLPSFPFLSSSLLFPLSPFPASLASICFLLPFIPPFLLPSFILFLFLSSKLLHQKEKLMKK